MLISTQLNTEGGSLSISRLSLCATLPSFLCCEFYCLDLSGSCPLPGHLPDSPWVPPADQWPGNSLKVVSWGNPRDDLIYFGSQRHHWPALSYTGWCPVFCLASGCLMWECKRCPCYFILARSRSLRILETSFETLHGTCGKLNKRIPGAVLRLWEPTQTLFVRSRVF